MTTSEEDIAAVSVVLPQGTHPDVIENATRQLRDDLRESGIDAHDILETTPPGTRPIESIALGVLAVKLLSSGGVIAGITNVAKALIARDDKRSVTIKISGDELTIHGRSTPQQEQLIQEFIDRHEKTRGKIGKAAKKQGDKPSNKQKAGRKKPRAEAHEAGGAG